MPFDPLDQLDSTFALVVRLMKSADGLRELHQFAQSQLDKAYETLRDILEIVEKPRTPKEQKIKVIIIQFFGEFIKDYEGNKNINQKLEDQP